MIFDYCKTMKLSNLFLVVVTAITYFGSCESAKILAIVPMFAKSHHYVIHPILKELENRGHQVTFFTTIEMTGNTTNIEQIKIELDLQNNTMKQLSFESIRNFARTGTSIYNMVGFLNLGLKLVSETLNLPKIKELIKSDKKFDLVILEAHFGQEAFVALGHRFDAPVITINPFTSYPYIDEFLGNPFATAYIPGWETSYTNKMTFFQRVYNAVRTTVTMAQAYFYYYPMQDKIMRENFKYPGAENIPYITDMLREISLVILTGHISVGYARPWVPNVIQVAGSNILPKQNPLPEDIQQFMDKSENGVIYVSFGTVIPSESMPEQMRLSFIKAFGRLKQNVLWKIDLDSIAGLPKNVKIGKWFPQQDILAHPKCLAFVTHGGLQSQIEAVYFGVPLIGVPIFADQFNNVARAAAEGFALALDSYTITEENLYSAFNDVINNPSYREKAKKQSEIFHDNPEPQMDKAMYWIEYVIRHKGAPHLRCESRNLSWIQYHLLDVIAFILFVLILSLFSFYLIIKFLSKCCTKRKTEKIKLNKKQN